MVEDDVLVRRALHRALAGFGHQVLEASSVDEAIAVLSTTPVDAVTLDVGLGERRGIDVARYIAGEVYPKPVMVVLTGEARPREAVELMQLGAHALLEKPIDIEQLEATIREPGEPLSLEPALRHLIGTKSKEAIQRMVSDAIVDEALAAVDGNVTRAAELLGTTRQAIYTHLSRRRRRTTPS